MHGKSRRSVEFGSVHVLVINRDAARRDAHVYRSSQLYSPRTSVLYISVYPTVNYLQSFSNMFLSDASCLMMLEPRGCGVHYHCARLFERRACLRVDVK